jgi:hypothetical protein
MTTTTYVASLASVPPEQVSRVRGEVTPAEGPEERRAVGTSTPPGTIELVASRIEHCPHDLTGIELFPLGTALAEAIDIGQPLRNDGWHPLRAPIVVDPETATAGAIRLQEAYQAVAGELGGMMAEVLAADIRRVIDLYDHASRRGEAVVSFLSAPDDDAQAAETFLPHVRVD